MADAPHPRSILRGHKAQVHALTFVRNNERLASGDADGYVVLWDLTILRPAAVWRPHENAILGIQPWGEDRIVTHGRDHKLAVWKITASDEAGLSKALPLDLDDSPAAPRPQPWLLHLMDVNTMNFCTFASCTSTSLTPLQPGQADTDRLLVAVPNTLASESVDIFHLPSQARIHTVKSPDTNGMVMALALLYAHDRLTLVAGYENGITTVMQLLTDKDGADSWELTYKSKAHSQPVLSLDVSPNRSYFITSSADAMIVKHPVMAASAATAEAPHAYPIKVMNTKHAGQQSLCMRDDSRIFATGGWDAMVRVYSTKTLKEVAALKWHQVGCYAVAFADVLGSANLQNSEAAQEETHADKSESSSQQVVTRSSEVSVKARRIAHAKAAHWLAAGSKDGKISLWDIY